MSPPAAALFGQLLDDWDALQGASTGQLLTIARAQRQWAWAITWHEQGKQWTAQAKASRRRREHEICAAYMSRMIPGLRRLGEGGEKIAVSIAASFEALAKAAKPLALDLHDSGRDA